MRIGVHAGHNPDNMVACGAIGLIKESTEARRVKDEVIRLLKLVGHTLYDCTVEDGTSVSDIVNKQVKKSNAQTLDLTVSIHFNSGAGDSKGNGVTTGVEVLMTSIDGIKKETGARVCNNIAKLGYKNRGNKVRTDLGFLNRTTAKAILIECCFVDDFDDIKLYNYKTMAKAIAEAIHNGTISEAANTTQTESIKNYAILYSNDIDKVGAEILGWNIENSTIMNVSDYKGSGYWGVIAVGGPAETELKSKYPSINFTAIKGSDRYETVKECLKHINKL